MQWACSSLRPHSKEPAASCARGLRFPDCRVPSTNCLVRRAAAAARRDMTCSCPKHIAAVEQRWGEPGNSQKPPAVDSVFQAEPRRGPLDRPGHLTRGNTNAASPDKATKGQGRDGVPWKQTKPLLCRRRQFPQPTQRAHRTRLEPPSLKPHRFEPLHHFERRPPPWHVGCLFRKMHVGGTEQGPVTAVPQADSRQPSESRSHTPGKPHTRRRK